MSNFEIIIDYKYTIDDSKLIGAGKRGEVYEYTYQGLSYIIKYENYMGPIETVSKFIEFSESKKPFNSTNVSATEYEQVQKKQNHYIQMAAVVNRLNHFVKIKGFVIFPNLNWKYGGYERRIFCSCLYENVGPLQREILPFNRNISTQLQGIFESFKQFNLAGYFHDDIQGCNNIEHNGRGQFYVLDYDVYKISDDNEITLGKLLVDIAHMYTCIMRYATNNTIINDTEGAQSLAIYLMDVYLKTRPTIKDNNNKKLPIKKINGFYYQETPDRTEITNINDIKKFGYNNALFYEHATKLENLDNQFNNFINDLKKIKSVSVNYNEFSELLKNYVDNYHQIIDFLSNLITNSKLNEKEKESVSDIMTTFHNICLSSILLFTGDTKIYFRDAKPILSALYKAQINAFKKQTDNMFSEKYLKLNFNENSNSEDIYKSKYLKYKAKYLALKASCK